MFKNLFMIGGPNGAGKTTSAFSLMPELVHCYEYINADAIAASLSPFHPEKVAIKAARIMIARIYELAELGVSFAFETTMASKTFAKLLTTSAKKNYQINLLYLWLPSAELAIHRVKLRVDSGGHNIPEEVIERRYYRSMFNLMNVYLPLCHQCTILDNSTQEPTIIAQKFQQSTTIEVYDEECWQHFMRLKQ